MPSGACYIRAGGKYYQPASALWQKLSAVTHVAVGLGRYRYFKVDRHFTFTFSELASLRVREHEHTWRISLCMALRLPS